MKTLTRNILMISVLLIPYTMIMYFLVMTILYMPLQEKETKNVVEYDTEETYEKEFFKENKLQIEGIRISVEDLNIKEEERPYQIKYKEITNEEMNNYLKWIIEAIDEMKRVFEFEKENWRDLQIVVCECTINDTDGNILGYILPYKNKIYISSNEDYSTERRYKDIVYHEVGHFIFENKLSYSFKKGYYEEYIEKKDFTISEKLEFASFYRQDKHTEETNSKQWSELIEEKIVEDIKVVLSENKINNATKKETKEEAIEKMKKEIIKEKDQNITNRKIPK